MSKYLDKNLKACVRKAVQDFWQGRKSAHERNRKSARKDMGNRGAVTSGKTMDGFISMISDLVKQLGCERVRICTRKGENTLPGYFRATKSWDLLIFYGEILLAAIELKSHVGSIRNNFNNRVEESIGSSHDFWTAHNEHAFGNGKPPFLGWLMLVEDCAGSRKAPRQKSPHFDIFGVFKEKSYIERYAAFCERAVFKRLYHSAALIVSTQGKASYKSITPLTSAENFIKELMTHLENEVARLTATSPGSGPLA